MSRGRVAGTALALVATVAAAPLALWTFHLVASAEEALATSQELVLIALALAVLSGSVTGLVRTMRPSGPAGAGVPLSAALLAALAWAIAAPL